jgi:serine-type D-Ala-D-Ala carboxypeptidase/endopeptidase (penicillin-binding protein 4)
MRWMLALFALFFAPPALAQTNVETILATAPKGTRIGLMVVDDAGREIVSVLPDQRFIPASNTKMFTIAAALATMTGLDTPDAAGGASVRIDGRDVVLTGHGDARLSSAPDCVTNCLAMLADAVAAKTRRVREVIGDATWLPDQRWSAGMSWNNVSERSGTAIAALTLDDNEVPLAASPGAVGQPPTVTVGPYFTVDNRAVTVASGPTTLDVARLPFERTVRLVGQIAVGAAPDRIGLGIDDPAHYAAWTLERMLKARGVRVSGPVTSRYRPALPLGTATPDPPAEPEPLARVTPTPLAEDLVRINKVSHNLHADLLLRRVGRIGGDGSIDAGLVAMRAMLERAGVPRAGYDFSDGSGMSTYNRVAPRGMIAFLRWVQAQPWAATFRATLPVGGVDGTLAGRFKGTPLEGRIFAKTGGLNATAALSGWMTAKSGRTLTFAMFANDIPDGVRATPVMDAALVAIANAD